MAEHIGADPTCPCKDGLPDPCTLCGEPADGTCQLDTMKGWKHRAEQAEAEVVRLNEQLGIQTALATNYAGKAVEYKQEKERAEEQFETLRNAIGELSTLAGLAEHFDQAGYPAHAAHLRRIVAAAGGGVPEESKP